MFRGTGLSCVSQEDKTWKCHVNESSSFSRCLGYGPADVMVSVLTHPFSPAFSCSYLGWGGECSLFLGSDSQMSYCFQYHSHWSSQHTTLEATCSLSPVAITFSWGYPPDLSGTDDPADAWNLVTFLCICLPFLTAHYSCHFWLLTA